MNKKHKKILLFLVLFLFTNISFVKADECTEEELQKIKEQVDEIQITYEHLGEVTKDDGSKVYNEFLVTTENIPDDIYIHLHPSTEEQFDESKKNTLKIKLTTGTWEYDIYSPKCDEVIDTIEVRLPTFNVYSLNELCDGIDPKEFEWCSKYYDRNIDQKTFENSVKAYRIKNHIDEQKTNIKKEKNLDKVLNIIVKYKLYETVGVVLITVIVITIIIKQKQKRKNILK